MSDKTKQLLQKWHDFSHNVNRATPIDDTESPEAKIKRIKELEADPEKWYKYYFPAFASSEPMPFHKNATRRVVDNDEWYEVRAWARELAKSTRTMFDVFYLAFVGAKRTDGTRHKKRNIIFVSNSEDNATRLLLPYKVNLETNNRLINDYGQQQGIGDWEASEFVTQTGIAFRAIGAGQSPRGTRNQEIRPDILLIDDMDTDQDCRNPEIIKKRWEWVEEALMATRSISGKTTVIFCGNIIAKDCCIIRAIAKADHKDIINIRDENGKSTWPTKNTEADIDRVLSKISYRAAQKEYYNNPITEGTVFQQMSFKTIRPLKDYNMLVCYTDPSYKESKKSDYKATVLVGRYKDEYHVIKAFVDQTTVAQMVKWHYEMMEIVGPNACYYLMEQVFLQEMFMDDFYRAAQETGKQVPITGDIRPKPDKFQRIEALLEPLNRNGKLYFNEAEKDHPGMAVLIEQFIDFGPGSRAHDDGPDAVEGAIWVINNKTLIQASNNITVIRHKPNKHRF